MKTALGISGAGVCALLLAACGAEGPSSAARPDDADRWVTGAMHVHSSHSDGAGSVADIARAGKEAGLDFILLTDHWSLDALEEGDEGYHDGVLILVGVEATTSVGHVLGFDLPATPLRFGRRDPGEVLRQIRDLGGFAMVAHPDGERDAFRWTGWDLSGYEGLELFNAYSTYSREGVARSLAYLLVDPFFQTGLLTWQLDWNRELMEAWDRMLPERRLAAWAGADAHGGIELADGYFLRWPSYEQVFRMARNHLLLEEPLSGSLAEDRRLIYESLRDGRGFVSLNDRSDGAGFRFWAEAGGQSWPMGSDIDAPGPEDAVVLRARVPNPDAGLRLFRNGVLVAETQGDELLFSASEQGVYRVDARLRIRHLGGTAYEPWIVSNPIALLPPEINTARRDSNMLPAPEVVAFGAERVTPYPLVLNVEENAGCVSLSLEPGVFGEASFRTRFELGRPPRGASDTYNAPWGRCALSDRRQHDLAAHAGVRFEVRTDAIYRVTLMLADRDPDSGSQNIGTTTFLTDRDWQEIAIPFSQLRGGRAQDLDWSRVSEISFFFDTSNTIPGTSGEVEIRGFALLPSRSPSVSSDVRAIFPKVE